MRADDRRLGEVFYAASVASAALTALARARDVCPELELPVDLPSRLASLGVHRPGGVLGVIPEPANRKRLRAPPRRRKKQSAQRSAWDPEPQELTTEDLLSVDRELDASSCRHMLMEVIRRAAYDWVLYRLSRKLQDRRLAEDAYQWLFVERPGTKAWSERERNGKRLTSLCSICDVLDVEPSFVRRHVRRLTVKRVMSVGRPSERRHPSVEDVGCEENPVYLHHALVQGLPSVDPLLSRGAMKKRGAS